MFMTDEQSAELPQPCVGAFDDPSPFVASQFPAIFVSPLLVVLPVRRDQLDASPFPSSLAVDRSRNPGPRSPVLASAAADLSAWGHGPL